MSDLVEKVARVICASSGDDPDMVFTGFEDPAWMEWVDNAKPAIRAALAHFAEAGNLSQGMFAAFNKAWDEPGGTVSEAFAAAMAAALKEMEG